MAALSGMTKAWIEAAVLVLALAACSLSTPFGPPSCGQLDVRNTLIDPVGPGEREEVRVRSGDVVVMGTRLSGPEGPQIADLQFWLTGTWHAERVEQRMTGPGRVIDPFVIEPIGTTGGMLTAATLDMPGEWRIEFTGDDGCRTVYDFRVELDTVLREYDVRNGYAAPPPPAGAP